MVKMYYGITWWRQDRTESKMFGLEVVIISKKRSYYVRYFLLSWVYYVGLSIEMEFVVLQSTAVFNNSIIALFEGFVALFIPSTILLWLYMRFLDRQNTDINNFRKETLDNKKK
jgi:hypothetical protein